MLRKMFPICPLILIITIIFSGCSGDEEKEYLNLQDVLLIAQQRRLDLPRYSLESMLPVLQKLAQEREKQFESLTNYNVFRQRTHETKISTEEAIHDLEILLNLMQRGYGGYIYFGGDETFLPVFAQMQMILETQNYWYITKFGDLIFDSLNPIINDNHFFIHNGVLGNVYKFFIPTYHFAFAYSESGFKNKEKTLYVEKIFLGEDSLILDEVFRLSLNEEGKFYYSFVLKQLSCGQNSQISAISIIYENGYKQEIQLQAKFSERRDFKNVSLEYIQDFPVITIQQMGFPDAHNILLRDGFWGANYDSHKFIAFIERLQNESVIILDIRSNRGGSSILPAMWLYTFTGEIVSANFLGLEFIKYEYYFDEMYNLRGRPFYMSYDNIRKYYNPIPLLNYHIITYSHFREIINNEQLLILLVDRYVSSAGEVFVDMVLNLKNSLIIGQNTSGALQVVWMSYSSALPNSRIEFAFGRSLLMHPGGHFREGVGIAPDIWVNGDALEATITMLSANKR